MSEVQNFRGDAYPRPAGPIASDQDTVLDGWFGTRLRGIDCPDAQVPVPYAASALADWSGLVDLVRAAARRLRQAEGQAEDQDRAFGQALRRARDAVVTAEQQAQHAETLAEAMHQRARIRIAAAEARAGAAEAQAHAAEGRACEAEAWRARVQTTILSEFPETNAQAAA